MAKKTNTKHESPVPRSNTPAAEKAAKKGNRKPSSGSKMMVRFNLQLSSLFRLLEWPVPQLVLWLFVTSLTLCQH
jgi:hypothetical protein